jgi:hypothetical protein
MYRPPGDIDTTLDRHGPRENIREPRGMRE